MKVSVAIETAPRRFGMLDGTVVPFAITGSAGEYGAYGVVLIEHNGVFAEALPAWMSVDGVIELT